VSEDARIGVEDLEALATGAAFLGAGGGGDPYIGRLLAKHAVETCGMPEIVRPEDLPDDAQVFTAAMIGAPTVLIEKGASGEEIDRSLTRMAEITGRKPDAISPIEIGGFNSMIPIVAAARAGLPLVDCDGMGRAFPELQMVTFNVHGVSASPAVLVDEYLQSVVIDAVDAKRTEDLARAVAIVMGLSAAISCYPMSGRELKDHCVPGTLRIALGIGRALEEGRSRAAPVESLLAFLKTTEYYRHSKELFEGKITDIERRTERGFNVGRLRIVRLDGGGDELTVDFQNENLVARLNGRTVAIVPDLVTVIDRETGLPITTEALKYGQRVKVIGTSSAPVMRSEQALAVFGPRAFGIDEDFQPIEMLHPELRRERRR
jgi:DUF917 family protein